MTYKQLLSALQSLTEEELEQAFVFTNVNNEQYNIHDFLFYENEWCFKE